MEETLLFQLQWLQIDLHRNNWICWTTKETIVQFVVEVVWCGIRLPCKWIQTCLFALSLSVCAVKQKVSTVWESIHVFRWRWEAAIKCQLMDWTTFSTGRIPSHKGLNKHAIFHIDIEHSNLLMSRKAISTVIRICVPNFFFLFTNRTREVPMKAA